MKTRSRSGVAAPTKISNLQRSVGTHTLQAVLQIYEGRQNIRFRYRYRPQISDSMVATGDTRQRSTVGVSLVGCLLCRETPILGCHLEALFFLFMDLTGASRRHPRPEFVDTLGSVRQYARFQQPVGRTLYSCQAFHVWAQRQQLGISSDFWSRSSILSSLLFGRASLTDSWLWKLRWQVECSKLPFVPCPSVTPVSRPNIPQRSPRWMSHHLYK